MFLFAILLTKYSQNYIHDCCCHSGIPESGLRVHTFILIDLRKGILRDLFHKISDGKLELFRLTFALIQLGTTNVNVTLIITFPMAVPIPSLETVGREFGRLKDFFKSFGPSVMFKYT